MDRLSDPDRFDGWIPVRLYGSEGAPTVDWCYLGRHRFTASSFAQTVEESLRYPANLLFRHQTPIEILRQWSDIRPGLRPTGFIFHTSRCGSTLVSQMLGALPQNIVISEARPIDLIVRAHHRFPEVTADQRIAWLRWMVSALAQQRLGEEKHFFIKFDAWNTLELPLVRRAFPEVPWIFVYRDPVEVLVSQFKLRGAQTVPGVFDPGYFGMSPEAVTQMEPEEYCARVLAAICQPALDHHKDKGLLINYTELPEAVWSSISKFFGFSFTGAEMQIIKEVANHDAKNATLVFQNDSAKKQERATERIREAADRWLYPLYNELETARIANQPV
jgi:Sulfotransferase domain